MSKCKPPRIIIELDQLIEQASVERSHYYVKSVCQKAQLAIVALMSENQRLRKTIKRALKFLPDIMEGATYLEIKRTLESIDSKTGGEA